MTSRRESEHVLQHQCYQLQLMQAMQRIPDPISLWLITAGHRPAVSESFEDSNLELDVDAYYHEDNAIADINHDIAASDIDQREDDAATMEQQNEADNSDEFELKAAEDSEAEEASCFFTPCSCSCRQNDIDSAPGLDMRDKLKQQPLYPNCKEGLSPFMAGVILLDMQSRYNVSKQFHERAIRSAAVHLPAGRQHPAVLFIFSQIDSTRKSECGVNPHVFE